MARRKPILTVVVSAKAAEDLESIYRYNAKHRGVASADRWEEFLKNRIADLATDYKDGDPIDQRPELNYLIVKKNGRGRDGHVVVYRIDLGDQSLRVLHIFHTKQDWENKL